MGLPAPNLDDRRFQDLVDDARRLVQRRCPEWTDHNVSDPGITLIETFAYLVDQVLYRLNRVPERSYVTFLELMGVELFAPSAARAPVTFWLTAPRSPRAAGARPSRSSSARSTT
jgi:predicted phage baseplate assembly protein